MDVLLSQLTHGIKSKLKPNNVLCVITYQRIIIVVVAKWGIEAHCSAGYEIPLKLGLRDREPIWHTQVDLGSADRQTNSLFFWKYTIVTHKQIMTEVESPFIPLRLKAGVSCDFLKNYFFSLFLIIYHVF